VNYLQLRERLGRRLGITREEAQDPEEWEMMGEVLNEAVIDILSRTRVHVRCLVLGLIDGETEYEMDDAILRLYNVRDDTGAGDMTQYDPADLMRMEGTHAFSVLGHNRLKLGWTPGVGEVVRAWYTPRPSPMTTDLDDPAAAQFGNISPEFHPALINYGSWQLADSSGDQASGRGETYRVRYEGKGGLAEIGSDLGKIRFAINKRNSGASPRHRQPVEGALISDVHEDYWVG
jgi:hypothetical protein